MKITITKTFLFAAVLFMNSVAAQNAAVPIKKKKPNIIFILADDLGYGDLGVFFQNQRKKVNDRSEPWMNTPNLDHLASMGAMLPQHYCAAPVCAPSRASLLLGVSQGHANVRDNQFDKALENNYTLASTLRTLGYATAAIGKWGLQGDPRWDSTGNKWVAYPLNRGFDYYFGYIRHNDGHEHYPKEGKYTEPKEVYENRTNITDKLDKCYTADLWTAVAKKWIMDFEKTHNDDPFFMYLAYETPHAVLELPTQPYPSGGGIKGGMRLLGTPGHYINTASGTIDSWIHPDYATATYDDDKNPSTPEVPMPDVNRRYATSVRRIDDGVGDIMQLLKDLKIDDNTLIVFSSDNGPSIESYLPESIAPDFFNSFGPFDGIKRDLWEGGTRMPTIAVWPGHIPAKRIIQTPSISYDWLSTFTDAAGVPAPARTDGVSLLPSLTGKGSQRKSLIYIEYAQNQSTPKYKEFAPNHRDRLRNQMQMIRFGDTLGVRYDIKSQKDNFEIYNVVKDPQETTDLAAKKGMDNVQKRMKEKVLQVRRSNESIPRPYDDELVPAENVIGLASGVKWKLFEGNWPWLPDVSNLTPKATGQLASPAMETKRNDNGIVYFEGYIKVPADGEYTFYLTSDAGAFLRIHDASIIDEDFEYRRGEERSATIKLQAGFHSFRIWYRQKKSSKSIFDFEWKAPGFGKEQIPAKNFYYKY